MCKHVVSHSNFTTHPFRMAVHDMDVDELTALDSARDVLGMPSLKYIHKMEGCEDGDNEAIEDTVDPLQEPKGSHGVLRRGRH